MRSFRKKTDNRRAIYLGLASDIESQLRAAFAKRSDRDQETQTSLAAKLGVDRSVVNRRLLGRTNMTIETIADMIWALGYCINVNIFDPLETPTNVPQIVPIHPNIINLRVGGTGSIAPTPRQSTVLLSKVGAIG